MLFETKQDSGVNNYNGETELPIRALILAGGLGTRLRPLTDDKPKCMFGVGDKPILGMWIEKLREIGCQQILVNTHHHADQVSEYLLSLENNGIEIITRHEEVLLGTAGTLLENLSFFDNCTTMLVHADNAMQDSLFRLIKGHYGRPKECMMTMLTFKAEEPSSCGIVIKDSIGRMREFHEKVPNPPGDCANGAVYVLSPAFIDYLGSLAHKVTDFSIDVLVNLCGKVFTVHTDEEFIDIGTPEALSKAQRIWREPSKKDKL